MIPFPYVYPEQVGLCPSDQAPPGFAPLQHAVNIDGVATQPRCFSRWPTVRPKTWPRFSEFSRIFSFAEPAFEVASRPEITTVASSPPPTLARVSLRKICDDNRLRRLSSPK